MASPGTALAAPERTIGRFVEQPDVEESGAAIERVGGNQPHTNMPPYECVNFIICLQGVFPSRE